MTSCRGSIRALNDSLRQHHTGGLLVITPGLQAVGPDQVKEAAEAVARFDAFSDGDDQRR